LLFELARLEDWFTDGLEAHTLKQEQVASGNKVSIVRGLSAVRRV
jgi:hypothetical protein